MERVAQVTEGVRGGGTEVVYGEGVRERELKVRSDNERAGEHER